MTRAMRWLGTTFSIGFSLLAAISCAAGGDGYGDDQRLDEVSEPTTCSPKLSYYPVQGKHNNGYDKNAGNSSLWTCDDAYSNTDYYSGHLGNDIWAAEGTPVVATVDGTLLLVGWSDYSGNKVTIKDGCGWYHFNCHLKSIAPGISNGKTVKAGTVIGYVGKTGTASNGVVHLHYSIYPDGNYDAGIDPWPYLHPVEKGVCGCKPETEVCNGKDDDCDGSTDEGDVCVPDQILVPQMGMIDSAIDTDVNGDGRADVCARSSFGIGCQLATDGGFDTSVSGPALSNGNGWSDVKYHGTVRMADVSGDGKADVCARAAAGVSCWLSDGSALATQIEGPPLSDDSGWGDVKYWSTIRVADVNADGKADLCARAAAGFRCWLSDGNGFPTAITGPELSNDNGWGVPQYYATLRMADVNGDGKADVCARSSARFHCWLSDGNGFPTEIPGPELSDANGWGNVKYWATLRMGDVNGDGKADVCARSSTRFHCWLSDGNALSTEIQGPELSDEKSWGEVRYYSTLRLADVSGDGKADVCARGSAGLHCWLSTGSGFGDAITLEDLSNDNGWTKPEYFTTIRFADVDGNGTADACARAAAGIRCWPFDGSAFGAAVAGPEWSDDSGWAGVIYHSTLQIAGGCRVGPETCNGKDDDCDGEVDEDCSEPGSGGSGSGGSAGWGSGGTASGSGTGAGASADPSKSSGDSGSCAIDPGGRSGPVGPLVLLGLAAALLARTRRRRS